MEGEQEQEIIARNRQLFGEHLSQALIRRVAEQATRKGREARNKAKARNRNRARNRDRHRRTDKSQPTGHEDTDATAAGPSDGAQDAAAAAASNRSRSPDGSGSLDGLADADDDYGDPDELGEFIDSQYLAGECFAALPAEVQSLSYSRIQDDRALRRRYAADAPGSEATLDELAAAIPASAAESLAAYAFVPAAADAAPLVLRPVLQEYLASLNSGPPAWHATRSAAGGACELCGRDWLPLTYHHLVPRSTHAKALKRGWHEAHMLGRVAWLCRACHSFVHRMAANEELARRYYTVDRIMEREDARAWARWVGRVRWTAK
ncbi:hypothetical protein KEM52_000269 [Ascosphaera acerosa]|nr:hypothetical protein KEM52_000269 [Ascosphaera acerosa]